MSNIKHTFNYSLKFVNPINLNDRIERGNLKTEWTWKDGRLTPGHRRARDRAVRFDAKLRDRWIRIVPKRRKTILRRRDGVALFNHRRA